MDILALVNALTILTSQIIGIILKDEVLTDEQKKEYISRIIAAQDSIPEWK